MSKILVPEGWKLVPVEMTAAMYDAMHEAMEMSTEWDPDLGGKAELENPMETYRAIIAAAPDPEDA